MRKAAIVISVILCFLLISGPLNIFRRLLFPTKSSSITYIPNMSTGNTLRISANNTGEEGTKILKVIYPSVDNRSKPSGVIVLNGGAWEDILALIPVARAYNSAIIIADKKNSNEIIGYLEQLAPMGIAKFDNTQVLVFGKGNNNINSSLVSNKLKIKYITYSNINELQDVVYSFPSILTTKDKAFVVSEKDPLLAIPVGTLVAEQGGILLFSDKDSKLYNSSRDVLSKNKPQNVYLVGNKSVASEPGLSGIAGSVTSITGYTAEDLAIRFAKFYDPKNGVGWNADRERNSVNHNFILANKSNLEMAALSTHLCLKGNGGPLLWTNGNTLSSLTENYLWRMKPSYFFDALEGPYNKVWIVGNDNIINYAVQARTDFIEEIQPYETMGEQGVSGIEMLAIIYLFISLFGALWLTFHLFLRMKKLSVLVKLMWILSVLILGPMGVWLYIISYIDNPWIMINGNKVWLRPMWKRTAVATVATAAFTSSVMIGMRYLMALIGLPLIALPAPYGIHLLGNPMIIQMVAIYITALLLCIYIFTPNMIMESKKLVYWDAVKNSYLVVFVSVTAISVGMMLSMWWLNMNYVSAIPRYNSVIWWGFAQIAALIGILISYIPNWWLVRYGKKLGVV
ncbi:MAG: DUF4396 domain-containing protein [Bacillota bacterium]|nr:DUF4396 domain-containing protein [Bacillota bacterium]